MTAAEPMDRAASLLNDTAKSIYTYVVQIPYLNAAIDELQEMFQLNNIPMTNEVSAVLPIVAGVKTITSLTVPPLPTDLIEIQHLYERLTGTTNDFKEMTKVGYLPPYTQLMDSLIYWTWQDQEIRFIGANSNRDVRINYIAAAIAAVTASTDAIKPFNSKSFLAYRTASLCARFIGENPTRADELDAFAQLAIDRLIGISVKGGQNIATRRRPFMSGFKVRTSL